MKKTFKTLIIALAVCCAGAALAKTPYRVMNVVETSSNITEYELTDVQEVTFEQKYRYSVTATSADEAMGTVVSGEGDYKVGESVQLKAGTTSADYVFVNWVDEEGNPISSNSIYSFPMPEKDIVLTATFKEREADPSGHEYVDLKLESGRLWATCNIGATNPEDAGNYYAWGEIDPKAEYTEANYVASSICSSGGTLPQDNDAAHANWGGEWRMPTIDECQELINECKWESTTLNGKDVYKITKDAAPDAVLYLPKVGFKKNGSVKISYLALYWTNESHNYYWGNCLNGTSISYGTCERYGGVPIRPVK